jgi:hypothetical protein
MRRSLAATMFCAVLCSWSSSPAKAVVTDRHGPQTGAPERTFVTVERPAKAGRRHKTARVSTPAPRRGGLVAVKARSGAVAYVAPHAAAPLQCVVDGIEAAGGHIKFMGGWRAHGSCRGCNKHPRGEAIDINQYARNVVRPGLPVNSTQIAQSCGVLHGAVWRNADKGHFEVGSSYAARRKPHRHRYARAG